MTGALRLSPLRLASSNKKGALVIYNRFKSMSRQSVSILQRFEKDVGAALNDNVGLALVNGTLLWQFPIQRS
jgi:hypothetical protein